MRSIRPVWCGTILPVLCLVCLACFLASCATSDGPSPSQAPAASLPTVPVSAAAMPEDIPLSVGDTLTISVFQVPDLNRDVQIDGSGQISLPLLGQVQAAGRTAHQLEQAITAKLGAKYLRSPQVTVFVKDSAGQKVVVDGEVRLPGSIPIAGQMTLVEAIARAGGPTDLADTDNVLLFRNINGRKAVARFNLDDIRAGKGANPVVAGGDTIVVDKSGAMSAWTSLKSALPLVNAFAYAGLI